MRCECESFGNSWHVENRNTSATWCETTECNAWGNRTDPYLRGSLMKRVHEAHAGSSASTKTS